jgi:hypothetical protein
MPSCNEEFAGLRARVATTLVTAQKNKKPEAV